MYCDTEKYKTVIYSVARSSEPSVPEENTQSSQAKCVAIQQVHLHISFNDPLPGLRSVLETETCASVV